MGRSVSWLRILGSRTDKRAKAITCSPFLHASELSKQDLNSPTDSMIRKQPNSIHPKQTESSTYYLHSGTRRIIGELVRISTKIGQAITVRKGQVWTALFHYRSFMLVHRIFWLLMIPRPLLRYGLILGALRGCIVSINVPQTSANARNMTPPGLGVMVGRWADIRRIFTTVLGSVVVILGKSALSSQSVLIVGISVPCPSPMCYT